MNFILVGVMIFIVTFFVVEMGFYAHRVSGGKERRTVRKRLKKASSGALDNVIPDIFERRVLSEVPFLNRMLSRIQIIKRLERLVQQANVKHTLGFFLLTAALLASMGYLIASLMGKGHVIAVAAALSLGVSPLLYLRRKQKKRMRKLQGQLPDGLDLIARALKAGHAFTTGMRLAADEFEDPLGTELDETLDEINFGVSVSDALSNLANRLDSPDVRYFVVSVLIQRTTGGNLAEILENIARLIRERIKFQGKVRVLSAEGKLSAVILIALPFVIVIALRFLNPKYMNTLFTDPAGRIMAGTAVVMMTLGALVMKKIITIEV